MSAASSWNAYIIDGIRTPIGSLGGALSPVRADDLAAHVLRVLMARQSSLDPAAIADVVLGCANQAGDDNRNVARMASLLAGLPVSVPGETVNRLCASGLSAVAGAARAIRVGEGDVYLAGGVESMTRAPFVMSKASSAFGRDVQLFDTSLGWRFVNPAMKAAYGTDSHGRDGGACGRAVRHFARRSGSVCAALAAEGGGGASAGRFEGEIAPVEIPQKSRRGDHGVAGRVPAPRHHARRLAKLRPAFRTDGKGSVTAGNASGLNDGAAALLLASERPWRRIGLTPRARVVAAAAAGVEPRIMGIGPVPATRLVLERAGLTLDQMDVIELNEAFAAQSLACMRELGLADDDARVNPNGGAIALGHPLGMSGARLALTATHELHARGGRYALCTMCIGVGQGYAVILERV
jgi:acetyl-CoA acyltransferase